MRCLLVHPVWLFLPLLACQGAGKDTPDDAAPEAGDLDADGDGYTPAMGDCDDSSAGVFPGAHERCNGADDDCDGEIDEDPVDATTWLPDLDGDGFSGPDGAVTACEAPAEGTWAEYVQDCDDTDPDISPVAEEVCNGIDDDCDDDSTEEGMVALHGADGVVPAVGVQAAVDASSPGDTVWICAGSWAEPLVVPHDLSLVGSGADLVEVVAEDEGPVLRVEAGSLSLTGLTLRGGAAEVGAGIDAREATALHLDGVVVVGSRGADDCGGVAGPLAGTTVLVDSVVQDHDVAYDGQGGCLCAHDLELHASELLACSATRGGGAALTGTAWLSEDSEIRENLALGQGGGLWLDGATVEGGRVVDNSAARGGGVGGSGSLVGVAVVDNGAQLDGGGAWVDGALTVVGGSFVDNEARDLGGAFWLEAGALTVEDLTLEGNAPDTVASEEGSWSELGTSFSCTTAGCSPGP